MPRLKRKFYTRDTIIVAKEMLGKYIVRSINGKEIAGRIVEVEVYIGPQDRASHAFKGKRTERNEAEYLIGGHIYIYLVYGMYWQFNISTGLEDVPECILIRALEPVADKELGITNPPVDEASQELRKKLANGPGKLCNYLKVDKSFNTVDMVASDKIWLEDRGEKADPKDIVATGRIGIDYAGLYWARRKWRFYLKNNSHISKI